MVSDSQRVGFHLDIPTAVLGNAIAPAFENMFASSADILEVKQNLALYASMPFRGLDMLLEVMKNCRRGHAARDFFGNADIFKLMKAVITRCMRRRSAYRVSSIAVQWGREHLLQAFAARLFYLSIHLEETYCIVVQEALAAALGSSPTIWAPCPKQPWATRT